MTDQVNNVRDNIRYISPQIKAARISTRPRILNTSIEGNPSVNSWSEDGGSSSNFGFGGDDDE